MRYVVPANAKNDAGARADPRVPEPPAKNAAEGYAEGAANQTGFLPELSLGEQFGPDVDRGVHAGPIDFVAAEGRAEWAECFLALWADWFLADLAVVCGQFGAVLWTIFAFGRLRLDEGGRRSFMSAGNPEARSLRRNGRRWGWRWSGCGGWRRRDLEGRDGNRRGGGRGRLFAQFFSDQFVDKRRVVLAALWADKFDRLHPGRHVNDVFCAA